MESGLKKSLKKIDMGICMFDEWVIQEIVNRVMLGGVEVMINYGTVITQNQNGMETRC